MRAREARSSSVRAASISRRRSASSAARRSVMSNSAPFIHICPPAPLTSWPRSSTQRISPSARTIRYSSENVWSPPSSQPSTAAAIIARSSGWTMLTSVRLALATKLSAGKPEIRSISSVISSSRCPACQAER